LTASRLLDTAALGLAVALASTLLYWWMRPEVLFLALLGVLSARFLVAPVAVPALDPRRLVAAAVMLYALGLSFVTATRHLTFLTHALDLGYYVQLTANLAGGRGPRVSLPEMHAWGDHFSPIMYVFVPLFWVAPGPVTLLVAQSVALALGSVAVFAIGRRRLGDERPAAAFALLYLVNPSLHGINVRDFHATALAIPLLLAAIWAVEAGRLWLFAVASALTLLCREDAALPIIGLGVWLAFGRRRWLVGMSTAAVALAVLLVDIRWVIPLYRNEPYPHLGRYAHLGASFGGLLAGVLLHPLRALAGVLTGARLVYLGAMLAPLGFLPLLVPRDLIGALPGLAQNLLASDPILYNHRTQYQAFVLPFLITGAIAGYARAARRSGRWPVTVLVVAFVTSLALASRTVNNFALARWWPTPAARAAYSVLGQVPPAAAVSAQDRYVAHLSLRALVFVFPVGIDKSDYVVVNVASYPWRDLPDVTMARQGKTVTISMSGGREYVYTVAAESAPHVLLRREPRAAESPPRSW
jgi:uncharacterized membrane protein